LLPFESHCIDFQTHQVPLEKGLGHSITISFLKKSCSLLFHWHQYNKPQDKKLQRQIYCNRWKLKCDSERQQSKQCWHIPQKQLCFKSAWHPCAEGHQEKLPKAKSQDCTFISAPLKALNQKHPTSFPSFSQPSIQISFCIATLPLLSSFQLQWHVYTWDRLSSSFTQNWNCPGTLQIWQGPSCGSWQVNSALCLCPQTEDATTSSGVCFCLLRKEFPLWGPTVCCSPRNNALKQLLSRKQARAKEHVRLM